MVLTGGCGMLLDGNYWTGIKSLATFRTSKGPRVIRRGKKWKGEDYPEAESL